MRLPSLQQVGRVQFDANLSALCAANEPQAHELGVTSVALVTH